MKVLPLVIVSALLGVVLGVGNTWATLGRYQYTGQGIEQAAPRPAATAAALTGRHPKIEVDEEEHDFDKVERDQTVEYAFPVRNLGDAPLELREGGTTCRKCTISRLPAAPVPPGGSAVVVVQYHADVDSPKFRQSATILTNDPARPRVSFSVFGKVVTSYTLVPDELVYSKLAVNDTKSAELTINSAMSDDFRVDGYELSDSETADHFQVTIEPVTPDPASESGTGQAYKVTVTVLPGLPLGPIRQQLRLRTNLADHEIVGVPIAGSIDSDLTIAGMGWDSEQGVLRLGVVKSSKGLERKLQVLIRGAERHDVQLKVEQVTPDWLGVKLGEPVDVNGGALVRIPLTVSIPPRSPAANYLGTDASGEIRLTTTHSEAKQLRMLVQFAVER